MSKTNETKSIKSSLFKRLPHLAESRTHGIARHLIEKKKLTRLEKTTNPAMTKVGFSKTDSSNIKPMDIEPSQEIDEGSAGIYQEIDEGSAGIYQGIDEGSAGIYQEIDEGSAGIYQGIDEGSAGIYQGISDDFAKMSFQKETQFTQSHLAQSHLAQSHIAPQTATSSSLVNKDKVNNPKKTIGS